MRAMTAPINSNWQNMRNSLVFILLGFCLSWCSLAQEHRREHLHAHEAQEEPRAEQGAAQLPRRPAPDARTAPGGKWEQTGQFPLPLAAARGRMRTRFEGEGYALKQEIALGTRQDRYLMLWQKGERQVLVMVWRQDVNQSGYSIGEVKNDRK